MAVPTIPPELRKLLDDQGLDVLYRFLAQDFYQWLNSKFDTSGDVLLLTEGKGIIMTNKAGTITKRVFLNAAGTDIDVETV